MRPIQSIYGIIDQTAIIEMAKASGLELIESNLRNPLLTSTFGTGLLILDALDKGCRQFVIGIVGSATNDGGTGMLKALGVQFLNIKGTAITPIGGNLLQIKRIDLSQIDHRLSQCNIQVACDVTNPLLGKNGASHVYATQKGADNKMIITLEENMKHFSNLTSELIGKDLSNQSGAGAAGGLGFGLIAYLNAQLTSGFSVVSKWLAIEESIQEADLIITGEGHIDGQSKMGKVPFGIAQLAQKHNKPVICIVGNKTNDADKLLKQGIKSIYTLVNKDIDSEGRVGVRLHPVQH
jgi:glycerate kinase